LLIEVIDTLSGEAEANVATMKVTATPKS